MLRRVYNPIEPIVRLQLSFNGMDGKFKLVAIPCSCPAHSSGSQFDHRICGKAGRESSRGHRVPNLLYTLVAIHIDEVYRKLHPKRMHSLTWNDPEALACCQGLSAEQALATARRVIGNVHASRKFRLPGPIDDREPQTRLGAAMPGK